MRISGVQSVLYSLSLCFALQAQAAEPADKTLSFKIAEGITRSGEVLYETGERVSIPLAQDGKITAESLAKISYLLRDRESDEAMAIDHNLPELLYELKVKLEEKNPGLDVVFHVISGYRSAETNENLKTDPANPYRDSVAQYSQHTQGRAIDIFVPELKGTELRDAAWCLGEGSVGAYPADYFPLPYIHLDTRGMREDERQRHWGFTPPTCEK